MKYELDFGDGVLECWDCGEAFDGAYIIEWQRDFTKQIVCLGCLTTLWNNDKDVLLYATISKLLVPPILLQSEERENNGN